ncbi:hypothetical protein [Thermanaeromonas toyohensis]|uniref:hypothetical protein n=1 Tax=Thermanaeromonas toyohensis TaxID=161154 RepID=UPI0009FE3E3C|nr:hypothetical protein [Thermanaeromonas toyohensis]
MNIDGFYLWHCGVCEKSVPESPNENDPWGYGNLLLLEVDGKVKQVCRDCISELGEMVRGKGAGFICNGISYTGPRAREWANEIIDALLGEGDIEEFGCGWPVMAMLYGAEEKPYYTSLVALVEAAQRSCGSGCPEEPDRCPVAFWAARLEVPFLCRKR